RHGERLRLARSRQSLHGGARAARLHRPHGALDAELDGDRVPERRRRRSARARRSACRACMSRMQAVVLAMFFAAAVVGPLVAPFRAGQIAVVDRRQAPSTAHWFGPDELGRDVLARVLSGARVSLAVGLLTALVAGVSGVAVGGVAGYAGGAVDAVLMRGTD